MSDISIAGEACVVRPGDTLILTWPDDDHIGEEHASQLLASIQQRLPASARCLAIDGSVRIHVVRATDEAIREAYGNGRDDEAAAAPIPPAMQ